MLAALARNWGWLMFRAIITGVYGLMALLWPEMKLVGFIFLFGVYGVEDGIVALSVAIDVQDFRGFGSLLFESLVRLGGGLVAMSSPDVIVTFPRFLAGWAILTGIAEAVSVIVALVLLLTPVTVGVPALRWLVGPYAIIFGMTLLAFARRLRQLAQEIEAA